jgi:LDH2 family malate/lactate/ureidoglycolate dehydrogenase
MAMRIDCFGEKEAFKERLSRMMNELRNEPPLGKDMPVQVAGDPEKTIARERRVHGIPLSGTLFTSFIGIGKEFSIPFDV